MNQQKIVKHLIELNETQADCGITTVSLFQDDSEKRFFSFVDKNPLFTDNTIDAVYEYLTASRKRHYEYHAIVDENPEVPSGYLDPDYAHKRDK